MRIAHVSTFPPSKCGIAFFASDLVGALPNADHDKYSLHYGDGAAPDACAHADVNSTEDLVALAKAISDSDCDVVALQHEFGIWGGAAGENLLPFLDSLTKPVLSVLHTTFGPGVRPNVQCVLLERLIERSTRVVLLTETAKRTTEALVKHPLTNAAVIPHGVPRFPYRDPPPIWDNGRRATLRLVTPGFFREDKGFEVILKALQQLRLRGHDVTYLIAGGAQSQFSKQEGYHRRVERLVEELGLSHFVHCDTKFLSVEEQVSSIQSCHVGVFAYQDRSQSSSGTIPLVLSLGRPVVCTPFEYAQSKCQEGFAVIVAAGFDYYDVADAIEGFLGMDRCIDLANETYARTRDWAWSNVGAAFDQQFRLSVGKETPRGQIRVVSEGRAENIGNISTLRGRPPRPGSPSP